MAEYNIRVPICGNVKALERTPKKISLGGLVDPALGPERAWGLLCFRFGVWGLGVGRV